MELTKPADFPDYLREFGTTNPGWFRYFYLILKRHFYNLRCTRPDVLLFDLEYWFSCYSSQFLGIRDEIYEEKFISFLSENNENCTILNFFEPFNQKFKYENCKNVEQLKICLVHRMPKNAEVNEDKIEQLSADELIKEIKKYTA
jgi:hypothetical protein